MLALTNSLTADNVKISQTAFSTIRTKYLKNKCIMLNIFNELRFYLSLKYVPKSMFCVSSLV